MQNNMSNFITDLQNKLQEIGAHLANRGDQIGVEKIEDLILWVLDDNDVNRIRSMMDQADPTDRIKAISDTIKKNERFIILPNIQTESMVDDILRDLKYTHTIEIYG